PAGATADPSERDARPAHRPVQGYPPLAGFAREWDHSSWSTFLKAGERILLRSRIARSAIQPQPTMIATRWNRPVGDPGKTPRSSRADTTVAATKNTATRTPVTRE